MLTVMGSLFTRERNDFVTRAGVRTAELRPDFSCPQVKHSMREVKSLKVAHDGVLKRMSISKALSGDHRPPPLERKIIVFLLFHLSGVWCFVFFGRMFSRAIGNLRGIRE
jgi:hypothetical protein